jgi:hypothetical protein
MTTTTTPQWNDNQTIPGFDGAIANGASKEGSIDLKTLKYDRIALQLQIIFSGTTDGPVEVEVLSSSDGGTKKDTISFYGPIEIEETDSATKRITIPIEGISHGTIKVTNNDSSSSVTASIIYSGRKWESA